ncbi:beta-propeller fold lactonase family protein [Paenarthrobacter sp. A20]|uniref:lactonase family protein n=1 Tax=Paenarthrobacter sp. A20 TaxID=2817891 RepID=UPI00209F3090|nr:beta-propeller fold lactonase family protein [Paenarthrobacter sp. A20]MCP1415738.1 6-phosphogluconolactonase (cycloisomerase 2 family) [Paenarthrobacter sp. A20]
MTSRKSSREAPTGEDYRLIWVGSYTDPPTSLGAGIGAVSAEANGRIRWLGTAVRSPSPSFLTAHPWLPVVYVVAEHQGTVQVYRRGQGTSLDPQSESWPAGRSVCHITIDPQARYLIAACWGDGRVIAYALDDKGSIQTRHEAPRASDPHKRAGTLAAGRQSRAHASIVLDDGRVMTTDLGFDLLRVWKYVHGQGLVLDHEITLPFGSGPRHLVQHPGGTVLVVTEYSIEVALLVPTSGVYTLKDVMPATATPAVDGDSAAEIALAFGGRFAYVGIRGSNRMGILRVDEQGRSVRALAEFSTRGNWPRHHLILGSRLFIAHERSHDIISMKLHPRTGLPGPADFRAHVGSPTVLIPAPVS